MGIKRKETKIIIINKWKILTILDYEEGMLDEMMQLFYDTVHTVNARDYRKGQVKSVGTFRC